MHILAKKLDHALVDIFYCFVYEFFFKIRNKNQHYFEGDENHTLKIKNIRIKHISSVIQLNPL